VGEQILNGTPAQVGNTMPFKLVHAGKYGTEDKSKTDTTKTKHNTEQESPADADKTARLKMMQKLLQFDVFRFISPNSISPNCQCVASRGMFSQALGLYCHTQFEIRKSGVCQL